METKFTKGKWIITDEDDNGLYIHDLKKTSAICRIYKENNLVKGKDGKYNALLISKAPEFYQDAKDDLELFDSILIELPLGLQHITNAIKERKKQKEQLLKEATEL